MTVQTIRKYNNFEIKENNSFLKIKNSKSEISLVYRKGNNIQKGYQILFENSNSDYMKKIAIPTSETNFEEMMDAGIPLDNNFTYCIVGEGLSNITEEIYNNLKANVYIIDPFDYNSAKILLNKLKSQKIPKEIKDKSIKLINRIKLYLNYDKIKLINEKVDDVLITNPELFGIADVVIDKLGPLLHARAENDKQKEEDIYNAERSLMKNKGYHFILT